MLGRGKGDCFKTVTQKYFANDLCRHLATMCRMYNDYGSVRRDRVEDNLNSVDFAEFQAEGSADEAKKALFSLAEYERECLAIALVRLQQAGGQADNWQRKMAVIRLFCDVTDLYGQLYVVRDMGTRMVQHERTG